MWFDSRAEILVDHNGSTINFICPDRRCRNGDSWVQFYYDITNRVFYGKCINCHLQTQVIRNVKIETISLPKIGHLYEDAVTHRNDTNRKETHRKETHRNETHRNDTNRNDACSKRMG